ncbi:MULTISPECIES: M4 family metallopeptidase [unclassified Nocardia]|uniref:M4 family metallopeptidase n=1 Tax=unclassified Nocardia TaxID=2637762 RepID=UPI001CE3B817|nr:MULTISPECIES: M4 family metallopeptidase [unclassified Nocardia]
MPQPIPPKPPTGSYTGSELGAVPKDVLKDPQGSVTQVTPKQPLPAPPGIATEPSAAAQAQADGVKKVFGDVPGELVVDKVLPVGDGSTVRLRQEIDGIPVFGAAASESLAADGSLLSVTGALATQSQGSYPADAATPPDEVGATALEALVDQTKVSADKFSVVETRANWYAPKLAALHDAASVAVPAYKVDIKGDGKKGEEPGRWVVFVDANDTGKVLDSWSNTEHLNRVICDAAEAQVDLNGATDPTTCGTPDGFQATRTEGQDPSGIDDVDAVYNWFGATENFYATYTPLSNLTDLIGSDTGDGNGKALRGTVRICSLDQCPYPNAFWNEGHMAYGEGVTTEDITGHELTHGVTEKLNGLIYRDDSGAINESMSDIFGEFTFLTDTTNPCNTDANRWQLGACSSLGVIRDMRDPHAHQQPDTYQGQYWYTDTSNESRLVHINSGVGNKAAELMVDGGTLNGTAVTGIGIPKTAALYYTTQTLLTPNATYGTLGSTLRQACSTNVQNHVAGTTADDCVQVGNAVKAVGMPSLQVNT